MSNPANNQGGKPDASVIVPGCGNPEAICELLSQLENQKGGNFEVLVVSDGCPAVEAAALSLTYSYPLSILNTHYREGFGVMLARNLGARFARGSQLIFLDPDIRIDDNTITGFEKAYESRTLLIGSIVSVDANDPERVIWPELRWGFRIEQLSPNEARFAGKGFATAFAAVDRKSFLEIGGFDMGFMGEGGSDTDFGLRHSLSFGQVQFLGSVVCRHPGLSSGKLNALGRPSTYRRDRQHRLLANGCTYYRLPENRIVNGGVDFFIEQDDYWRAMVVQLSD